MYTTINTNHAMEEINNFLNNSTFLKNFHFNKKALLQAIEIVMKDNIFKFNDTYWMQKSSTAMGTPPGANYANLYYSIYKLNLLKIKYNKP